MVPPGFWDVIQNPPGSNTVMNMPGEYLLAFYDIGVDFYP